MKIILAGSISFHVSAQTKKIDTSAQLGNAKKVRLHSNLFYNLKNK